MKLFSGQKTLRSSENWTGNWMTILPFLGFLLFGAIPIIISFVLSFMKLNTYDISKATWIGLENFEFVLKDERFIKSLKNTLAFTLSVPISLAGSLFLAMLISKEIKGVRIFRTIFFIPYVCSPVAVSTMWKWMYDYNYGVLNSLLSPIGLQIPWLNDERYFMLSVVIMSIWGGMGYGMIMYQSALNNVNPALYEAAELDGAGKVAKFFRITLPMISPTTFYLLVTGLIGALQNFVTFQIMGGDMAGPNESGLTTVFYLYRMAFRDTISYGMGYASATAWILSVVILIVTVINFKVSKKWVYEE
jgi:multiple sugar transport system permease protein